MKIENIHEAKAFIFFLTQERVRHAQDIKEIDKKIEKVTQDFNFWVE